LIIEYKEHFGGIYYFFLRGMTPKTGADFGIYRDCPAEELIGRLSVSFGSLGVLHNMNICV